MSEIGLLNHELLLLNRDDLEVVVSSGSLELWNRYSGECLSTFDDVAEAAYEIGRM
jgi:hypothetical protein